MSKILHGAGLAALILVAGGLGFFSYQALQAEPASLSRSQSHAADSDAITSFNLPDVAGAPVTTSDFPGQWLLVNFWATWCAPCLEEMPLLDELDKRYDNMQVLGVALDNRDAVQRFQQKVPVEFPLLIADSSGSRIARQWGNDAGALPFTALVNPRGVIEKRWATPLEADKVHDELAAFLR